MSSPARSDAIIDAACKTAGITRDGCTWLKWGVNPFGDNPENLAGYPDDCMSDSVPQVVKQQLTIACPNNLNANWDVHIVHTPWRSPVPMTTFNQMTTNSPIVNTGYPAGNCFQGGSSLVYIGGLQIMAVAAGQIPNYANANNWSPSAGFSGGATSYSVYMCPDPTFTSGTCRIVGSGWEVHNTTADLYKQGAVTVYRQPVPNQTMVSQVSISNEITPNILSVTQSPLANYVPHPPLSLSDAMLYPNSKTWEAKEGVYAVDMFHDTDIKPQGPYFVQPLVVAAGSNVATTFFGPIPSVSYSTVTAGTPGVAVQMINWPDVFWTQTEQTGAWFTGLSQQSTLTINILTLIERFPTIGDDPNLLVVATPSAMDDALARKVYADTIRQLPVAVPVKQNSIGEWVKNAASTVLKVVRPLVMSSGDPRLIGALVGGEAIYGLGKNFSGGKKSQARAAGNPPPAGKQAPGNSWVGPKPNPPKQKWVKKGTQPSKPGGLAGLSLPSFGKKAMNALASGRGKNFKKNQKRKAKARARKR